MRRLALATATLLALVTGAVTAEQWTIVATVNGDPTHTAVYGFGGDQPLLFESRGTCEHVLGRIAEVREGFEQSERQEHGPETTVTWACVTPGQDI